MLLQTNTDLTYPEFITFFFINMHTILEIGVSPFALISMNNKPICTLLIDSVYDVTRRETFTNLADVWAKELDLYSTNQDCIKMLVGNKVDKESDRVVSRKEGIDFAREYGCLFLECSAKTRVNVEQCFEELVLKILETPSLLAEGSAVVKRNNIFKQKPPEPDASTGRCC
uniref:Uncharacterized protein n=1 Tax=Kalanchoe fedtschenkoi TaxID=63787 RepID=A0A7N0UU34_KALFE